MKKIIAIYKSIPSFIIFVMVFLPFLANLVCSNTQLLDNRPLHQKPTEFGRDFSKKYEDYYNDTFAGRKSLVKKYLKLKKKLKINTGAYFEGLNDWMYYDSAKASDGNSIIDYKGEVYFSDDELKKIAAGMNKAKDFYAKKGINYIVVVAPNKENVYAENMPLNMQKARKSDKSRADDAIEYMNKHTKVKVLNLKANLLNAKAQTPHDLYFKRDTHWNAVGAYIGYSEIVDAINVSGIKLPNNKFAKNMVVEKGMIPVDMDPNYREIAYEIKYYPNIKPELKLSEDRGNIIHYNTKGAVSNKSVLMIRDSFAADLIPFFSKSFASSLFLHQSKNVHENIDGYIAKYKPNLVIDEVVERDFEKFLKYNDFYGEK